jgi:hypothetical protein
MASADFLSGETFEAEGDAWVVDAFEEMESSAEGFDEFEELDGFEAEDGTGSPSCSEARRTSTKRRTSAPWTASRASRRTRPPGCTCRAPRPGW